MSRIAPLEPPYETRTGELLASMMPPGVPPIALFRTLAHSPRVMQKLRDGNLLDRGPLSLRQRELVILRTTARCGSEYEWGVHVSFFAERARLDPGDVAATVTGTPDDTRWTAEERAILKLVDELHESGRVGDKAWNALSQHFRPEQYIELVALVGLYHTVAFFTNAFEVELETGAPRFPPGDR